jgi:uncharacterized tellurite resistance protein B-like protein
MFEHLKKIFSQNEKEESITDEVSHLSKDSDKIKIAACALFIEMAQADGEFSEDERKFIISEMNKTFNLDEDCTNDLMELAERRVEESISIYEFSSIINATFTKEQKISLIESLWRLIYQDEKLNAYEDQLIKKIGGTLNIEHKQIINAKLLVKEQMGLNK